MRVMFENQELGQGMGQRKRDAEQEAARIALDNLLHKRVLVLSHKKGE